MVPSPHGVFGRLAAVAWLLAWLAVLAFAIVQRDIRDTDIAVAYFILFLSFPAGYLVAAGIGMIFYALYEFAGVVVPGGLVGNVGAWLVLGGVGYAQSFIAVPWLYRKVKASSFERTK